MSRDSALHREGILEKNLKVESIFRKSRGSSLKAQPCPPDGHQAALSGLQCSGILQVHPPALSRKHAGVPAFSAF